MLKHFDTRERKILRSLGSPARIQQFLDTEIRYNLEPSGDTCYSPQTVLRKGVAHCMEGAMLAAAALRILGHPPLLVDLEAVRDTDHVLAVYRVNGCWGAVAKSDYSGLRSREPVYRNIRELVMSYFEHYFNPEGEKTLRAYSRPVNLRQFDTRGWMTSAEDVWVVPNYLCEIKHTPVLTRAMLRRVAPMDKRLYAAGRLGGLAH
jgi:transglutaminase superfamily protein